MKNRRTIIILVSILGFSFQLTEEFSDEEIYSRILTEFLSERIAEDEGITKIIIKTDLQKQSLGEELKYNDLSYLLSISEDFVIIEGEFPRPDSLMIEMVNKFERNQESREIGFERIQLPYDVEFVSQKKFLRQVKRKNGWNNFHKKHPDSFGVIEISNLVFSEDRRYCVLYIGYSRGGLNGYGCILIADLEGNELIKGEIELWIS